MIMIDSCEYVHLVLFTMILGTLPVDETQTSPSNLAPLHICSKHVHVSAWYPAGQFCALSTIVSENMTSHFLFIHKQFHYKVKRIE